MYARIKNMKIVHVIPLVKGPLRGNLTYFTAKNIESGSIVTVTLRNKKILALVVSSDEVSETKISIKDMNFNLKKIIEVKEKSVFLKEYLGSILEVSKYFATSKNNVFASLLPAIFRENYDKISKFKTHEKNPSERPSGRAGIKTEKLLLQEPLHGRISIYKTLIRENFALKKSVFIVLPTEEDIKNFEEYLSKGIGDFVFSMHSGLSAKKILEKFEKITSTAHPVLILGTAPFLCVRRRDIGTIILEHESSGSYKMIARPHIDLRIFVEIFSVKINARLITADTLLRFETIAREDLDYHTPMHPLTFRVNFNGEIEVENKVASPAPFKIFSDKTIKEIENTLTKKKRVFIFTLRRGLATQTFCRDCGEMVSCKRCKAPLVLYNLQGEKSKERTFICNRCGLEKSGETTCDNCQSWNLIPLGIGTDTVFEEISKKFPKTKILKLDKESAKNKKGVEKIIKDFETNGGSILVGTEMATHYLKNKVALSVIASFDSLWSIPNFRMSERVLQLVSGLTSISESKLIIQTKNDRDKAILAITSLNLLHFIRDELKDRKKLNYPPYKRFIKIKHLGNKLETIKAKELLAELFKEYKPLIFSGFMAQLKGKYATNALIKMDIKKWSLPALSNKSSIDENLLARLLSLPPAFEIFVDPEDLL